MGITIHHPNEDIGYIDVESVDIIRVDTINSGSIVRSIATDMNTGVVYTLITDTNSILVASNRFDRTAIEYTSIVAIGTVMLNKRNDLKTVVALINGAKDTIVKEKLTQCSNETVFTVIDITNGKYIPVTELTVVMDTIGKRHLCIYRDVNAPGKHNMRELREIHVDHNDRWVLTNNALVTFIEDVQVSTVEEYTLGNTFVIEDINDVYKLLGS